MNKKCLSEKEISTILQTAFGIKPIIQVYKDKGTGRILYSIEHIPANRKMSIGGLKHYCHKICHALDADLDGTVNIEFVSIGDVWTFDILAEARLQFDERTKAKTSVGTSAPISVRNNRNDASDTPLAEEEFRAVDNLNEAVFNLYEHAAAQHLDTLSPELADMIEDAWKFLQPVKRLGLVGRMTDNEFRIEKERREKDEDAQ